MALPRLTGALRSFSNVTKQDNYNEEVADLKGLANYSELVIIRRIFAM